MATTAFDIGSLLESIPGHLDGRPVIAGTRVSVQKIALLSNEGLTAEEIARDVFDWLTLAQVHAALTYYHANREAIDADLAAQDAETDRLAAENAGPGMTARG